MGKDFKDLKGKNVNFTVYLKFSKSVAAKQTSWKGKYNPYFFRFYSQWKLLNIWRLAFSTGRKMKIMKLGVMRIGWVYNINCRILRLQFRCLNIIGGFHLLFDFLPAWVYFGFCSVKRSVIRLNQGFNKGNKIRLGPGILAWARTIVYKCDIRIKKKV